MGFSSTTSSICMALVPLPHPREHRTLALWKGSDALPAHKAAGQDVTHSMEDHSPPKVVPRLYHSQVIFPDANGRHVCHGVPGLPQAPLGTQEKHIRKQIQDLRQLKGSGGWPLSG